MVSVRGFYNIGGPGGGGPDSGGPDGGGSDGGGPDGGGPEGGGPDGGGPDGGVSVVTVYTFVESKYLLTPAMFTSQSYLLCSLSLPDRQKATLFSEKNIMAL